MHIVSNYCGAHSVPSGMTVNQYAEEIVSTHIPTLKRLNESGETNATLIDVFYEKGVFERTETIRVLKVLVQLFCYFLIIFRLVLKSACR